MKQNSRQHLNYVLSLLIIASPAVTAETNEELAKKLANPVASLISLPFQFNYDKDFAQDKSGDRYLLNLQPVIPITLNEEWNLISRTILPISRQSGVTTRGEAEFGLGDTVQSVFFSPKQPVESGWIWGVGPVLALPTATDSALGSDKWSFGPTAVALKQSGSWTYGALVNHLWSVAGSDNRQDLSISFMQPFLSYTTKSAVTFALNTESSFDWKSEQSTVPINFMVTKVSSVEGQIISIGGGVRYWAEHTPNGPQGWGIRMIFTLLFPR